MGDQIIDQNAEIGLGPINRHHPGPGDRSGSVDARQQPLGRRFFIAGRAVDLSGQKQAGDVAHLQACCQAPWVDIIILDGITRPQDPCVLEPRHRRHKGDLDVLGKRGGDPVGIDRRIVQTFRLQEYLMGRFVGESNDLVLDGGTIPRSTPADRPGINRGAIKIGADQRVAFLGGPGHAA